MSYEWVDSDGDKFVINDELAPVFAIERDLRSDGVPEVLVPTERAEVEKLMRAILDATGFTVRSGCGPFGDSVWAVVEK